MVNIFYLILISIFLASAILMETVGVWGRVVGAYQMSPALGYSLHVRIATMGRFFTLFAGPSLGYLVDTGYPSSDIALCGCLAFMLVGGLSLFSFRMSPRGFFRIFAKISKSVQEDCEFLIIRKKITHNYKYGFLCAVSFGFTAVGMVLVNLLGAEFHSSRAMLVQMSTIITSLGTMLHVYFIDPKLAESADRDKLILFNLSMLFILYRAITSFLICAVFFFIYLLLVK